jgi:hypothetical protein
MPGAKLPLLLEILSKYLAFLGVNELLFVWFCFSFKSWIDDYATQLLVSGSEKSEHQSICLVVICDCMCYGEWVVDIHLQCY